MVERNPVRVAVTGSSGLVGSRLVTVLRSAGDDVCRIVRQPPRPDTTEVAWDPMTGNLESAKLTGIDAVVHLAGENIATGRWTAVRKNAISQSRVEGTRLLCEALGRLDRPPRTLVCASAIGYYGDRGEERLTESSPPGKGFLAEVCQAWEAASLPARQAGIRVVNLRIGVVLSTMGGALAKMLTPFRMGVGGTVGSGRQFMSWIALEDLIGAVQHVLDDHTVLGPVNAVAPNPVTNHEFTKTLGRVLRRPTIAPIPGFLVRLAFGEMGSELLLSGARIVPQKLHDSGFEFKYPTLESALRAELTSD